MKKTTLFYGLISGLLLLSASCKKSESTPAFANQANVKINGITQSKDSMVVKAPLHNSKIREVDIFLYNLKESGGICAISLLFDPANPAYATGTTLNIAGGDLEINFVDLNGTFYDDDPFIFPTVGSNPQGVVVITDNDVKGRKISGTISGCILPAVMGGAGNVTIDGSFSVSY